MAVPAGRHLPDRPAQRSRRRRPPAQLARETGHAEIAAWCLETQAWQVLTTGDYQRAADIAQAAQHVAPRDGSAFIQATAQEGRAWARLGAAAESRTALARLDLSLALIAAGRHDEAAGAALHAVTSGRLVPSNYWRAREVIRAVGEQGLPEARELSEAYRETCNGSQTPELA